MTITVTNPYREYLLERTGNECLEMSGSFILYRITGDECRIVEIYVPMESRKSGIGSQLTDAVRDIAKDKGCRYLTASTFNAEKGTEQAIMATLSYGFKIHEIAQNEIRYYKEIR